MKVGVFRYSILIVLYNFFETPSSFQCINLKAAHFTNLGTLNWAITNNKGRLIAYKSINGLSEKAFTACKTYYHIFINLIKIIYLLTFWLISPSQICMPNTYLLSKFHKSYILTILYNFYLAKSSLVLVILIATCFYYQMMVIFNFLDL